MALWGSLTCIMAVVKTYSHLVALRAILGKANSKPPTMPSHTTNGHRLCRGRVRARRHYGHLILV